MTTGRPTSDELLSAYYDGELADDERAAAERLLDESADAGAELDDYRELSELLRRLPIAKAPPGLRAAVLQQIDALPDSATRRPAAASTPIATRARGWKRSIVLIAGGLTAAVALLLGINLFDDRFGEQPRPGAVAHEFAATDANGTSEAGDGVMSATESSAGSSLARGPAEAGDAAAHRGELSLERHGESFDRPLAASPLPGREMLEFSIAGDEARPPDDAVPGDVYHYLERTDHGVVVVEATVVDVRRALDRVQTLLARNAIPTRAVGIAPESQNSEHLSATAGELAVYVESDPEQLNRALQALDAAVIDDSDVFFNFQVSGVLETPPAAAAPASSSSLNMPLMANQPPNRDRSGVGEEVEVGPARAGEVHRDNRAMGRTLSAQPRPESPGIGRYSVPSEDAGQTEVTPPGVEVAPAPMPRTESLMKAPPEPAIEAETFSARTGSAPPPTDSPAPVIANYNQIVSYPEELKNQVRLQEAARLQEGQSLAQQLQTMQEVYENRLSEKSLPGRTPHEAVPTQPGAEGDSPIRMFSAGSEVDVAPLAAPAAPLSVDAAPGDSAAQAERGRPGAEPANVEAAPPLQARESAPAPRAASPPGQAGQQRMRLLLVLQAGDRNVDTDVNAAPVEAPRPSRTTN